MLLIWFFLDLESIFFHIKLLFKVWQSLQWLRLYFFEKYILLFQWFEFILYCDYLSFTWYSFSSWIVTTNSHYPVLNALLRWRRVISIEILLSVLKKIVLYLLTLFILLYSHISSASLIFIFNTLLQKQSSSLFDWASSW